VSQAKPVVVSQRSSLEYVLARIGSPILLLAAVAVSLRPGLENDAWWHMASGRWMLDRGAWLTVDPFSWTMQGQPWPRPGLVADVAMAALHRAGGIPVLVAASAVCFVAAVGLVLSSARGSATSRFLVGMLAVVTMISAATPRPLVASLALTAACMPVLEHDRFKAHGSRWIWILPLIAAAWVNVHGAFVVLFVLLACHGLGTLLDGLRQRQEGWQRRVMRLGGVGLLVLLATSINPFGFAMLVYPLETLQLGVLAESVDEWRRPALSDPQSWPLLGMVALSAVAVLRARQPPSIDVVLLVAFGGLALTAVRHGPIFAIVAFPVVVRLWSDGTTVPLRAAWSLATSRERRMEGAILVVIAGLSVLLVSPALTDSGHHAAIAAMHGDRAVARAAGGDLPARLWNSYDLGGHVIWLGSPEVLVSMDSRTDLHGDEDVREHIAEWHGERDAPARFERDGIRTVLVERQAPLVQQLEQAGWERVELDDVAVVLRAPT
jgi:hypothetical protein